MSDDKQSRVLVEIKNDVAIVSLNRGHKYNGLDMPMFKAIASTAKQLRKNRDIRAVILRGEGPAFCSGLDVMSMKKDPLMIPKLLIKPGTKISNLAQDVCLLWRELPVPVIAVTHGKCYGGGLQIAMGADFRFSTPECEFSIMEAKWGLIPDMGGMVVWRELMRADALRQLTYTGKTLTAEEALDYGLISRIDDDPMQAALDFIEEIKQRSPDSVAASKVLINHIWSDSVKGVLAWETRLQKKIIGRWNQLAASKKNFPLKEGQEPMAFKPRKIK